MPTEFTVEIQDEKITLLLQRLNERMNNMTPVMQSVAETIYNSVMENFQKQCDPMGRPWKPLSPVTIKIRKRKHPRKPIRILQETFNLMRSIHTEATRNEAIVGTGVEYAATHQFGKGNIPARPFLGIKDRDIENIIAAINAFFLGD